MSGFKNVINLTYISNSFMPKCLIESETTFFVNNVNVCFICMPSGVGAINIFLEKDFGSFSVVKNR